MICLFDYYCVALFADWTCTKQVRLLQNVEMG